MNAKRTHHPVRAALVHLARLALVVLLLLLIPAPSRVATDGEGLMPPALDDVQRVFPQASSISESPNAAGLWLVTDVSGDELGLVGRTLPIASEVVGYRGPSEAIIGFDQELGIRAVALLQSADTREHVDAVVDDEFFFEQFVGWNWGASGRGEAAVEGVSGATLTSLAIAEGVIIRIGGERPSLVFPEPLTDADANDWFGDAKVTQVLSGLMASQNDRAVGQVIRTGVYSDDIAGYQGPTELLLRLDENGVVKTIKLRQSFDNEPYVDYVRVEVGFWALFEGRSIRELAAFDPAAEGIEGVSGATMTSLAVADTLVAAAKAHVDATDREKDRQSASNSPPVRWAKADLVTLACLLGLAILSRFRKFHRGWPRRIWLAVVIAVLGVWSGNLISMALTAGWSAEGVAWRLAPGLAAVVAVAAIVPVLAKGNPYCNHLCPHGAIQQLIKPSAKSRRRIRLPRRANAWLQRIPGVTLTIAYVSLLLVPTLDLSSWEPFHAYLFRVAGWTSFVLAGLSLAVAAVIPMGYCRLGCPTGSLLDYLRRSATSDRIRRADWIALGLLVLALGVHWIQG